MMKFKLTAIIAAVLLVPAGCQRSPDSPNTRDGVEFATTIGEFSTRAADDHWDAGDEVGIYMMVAGETLDSGAPALNRRHTTTGDGTLTAATTADEIFYPDNGDEVDFIAYYPWKADIADFTFPVNVAVQTPMSAIDLLYSDNAKGYSKGDSKADMTFTHRLTKIVLNIVDQSESISLPSVTLEGIPTTAGFDLTAGALSSIGGVADVAMVVSTAGDHAFTAEAIVIPGEADFTLLFVTDDKKMRLSLSTTFAAGKKYLYNVTVTDKAYMEGEGEIEDWDEEPGEDMDLDVKELERAGIPLVYRLEKPAEVFPLPPMPTADEIAALHPGVDIVNNPDLFGLPDIFKLSNGTRITEFSQWEQRRAEIMAYIGNYEMGMKPDKPASVVAAFEDNWISVAITHNGVTLNLVTNVSIPDGDGPFPVVIGMNGGPDTTLAQGSVRIQISNGQLNRAATAPFGQMYPELAGDLAGDVVAWSWGVSRMIDGLEQLVDEGLLAADLDRIAVYGCSYAGMEALFAGAFDERIALTVAKESGDGGIDSWRISDQFVWDERDSEIIVPEPVDLIGIGNMINRTWFSSRLQDFRDRSCLLPFDHHELIALIAPRAVLIHGNPDYVWMADKGGYSSVMAAYEVWKAMGIEDRLGFDFSDGHAVCTDTTSQTVSVEMFRDKFLFGIETPTELIRKAPAAQYLSGLSADPDHWIDTWKDHTLN